MNAMKSLFSKGSRSFVSQSGIGHQTLSTIRTLPFLHWSLTVIIEDPQAFRILTSFRIAIHYWYISPSLWVMLKWRVEIENSNNQPVPNVALVKEWSLKASCVYLPLLWSLRGRISRNHLLERSDCQGVRKSFFYFVSSSYIEKSFAVVILVS